MRLLDRYLLRELLVPLAFCLAGFFIFVIVLNVLEETENLQEMQLQASDMMLYYVVRLLEPLPVVLPVSLLLAMLYTLTTFSRNNEIMAMRTAGVSLWRLAAPYFTVGVVASMVLFAFNELWIADITERAELIKTSRVAPASRLERHLERNFGFNNSRDGREWHMAVYDQKTAEMVSPQVHWTQADGSRRWLYAERAVRTNGVWVFLNAREYRDAVTTNTPPVPVLQASVLPMPAFTETPRQIKSEIKVSRRLSLRNMRNQDIPLSEISDYLRFHPRPQREDRFRIYTNLHKRLAAPWVCLVVVFIALPFGAASGRRNIFAGVAGSVFICFGYFALQQLAYALGLAGYMAPWLAAWLPNLVFGIAGAWMMARVR